MAQLVAAAERGPLRNRAFLAMWFAQILSQVAANATTFALIVLVAERTHSNLSSSLLILLSVVPAVLFGVFAGVVVDRSDRKRVLIVTNGLRAAAVGIFLLLSQDVAAAYLVNVLVATITVFFVPAEAAMLPAIVRKRDLLVANSLFTFTFNGAFLAGFVIFAPIVIKFFGFDILFGLLAAMFAGAALLCFGLPASAPAARPLGAGVAGLAVTETRRGLAEVLTAFNFLRASPLLVWSLVYISIANTLVAVAGALAPGFVREVLGLGERDVIYLVAPAGLGVVAGLLLLNFLGTRLSRANAIGIALVVLGMALVALALARPFAELFRRTATAELGAAFPFFVAVLGVVMFVFGMTYAGIIVPAITMLQEELHEDIRGRVFGVLSSLVSIFSFLPLVIVGPVADVWGVAPVFLGSAIVVWGAWLGGGRARRAAGAGGDRRM
ncbi:MAG: MFS transporter [Candidatus Limnocylindria bacterium]|nr:MFS transporter [Candidatus Limnocylindria bacterium]